MYEKIDSFAKRLLVHKFAPQFYAQVKSSFIALVKYQRVSGLKFSLADKLKFLVYDRLYGEQFNDHLPSRRKLLEGVRFLDECFNPLIYHRAIDSDFEKGEANRSWAEDHFVKLGFKENIRVSSSLCLKNLDVYTHRNFQSFIANLELDTMELTDAAFVSNGASHSNVAAPLVPWGSVQSHLDNLTIIVPVYEGYKETVTCLRSLKEAKTNLSTDFLIINDASPNAKISKFIKSFCHKNDDFELLENDENYGFTESINIGLRATSGDVIILNSDTVVTDYWIDRMAFHRATNRSVGTITVSYTHLTLPTTPYV